MELTRLRLIRSALITTVRLPRALTSCGIAGDRVFDIYVSERCGPKVCFISVGIVFWVWHQSLGVQSDSHHWGVCCMVTGWIPETK